MHKQKKVNENEIEWNCIRSNPIHNSALHYDKCYNVFNNILFSYLDKMSVWK